MDNDSSSIYKNSIFSSTGFKRSAFNNNNNNSHTHMTYSMNTSLNTDTVKILNCLRTVQNTQANNTNCLIKEYTYDDIKRICMKVFMNYAMPRNGQFFLSYQSLFKILVSANIINEQSFPLKEADLIAQKVVKGNRPFTSDDFLNYIAKLASRLDNEYYQDRKATMINFVKTHFEPLAIKLDNNRDQSLILNKFNRETTQNNNTSNNETSLNNSLTFQKFIETFVLDENSYLVLTSIAPALKQIYSVYFQYENSNQHDLNKIEKGSYSNFISFCKDFEISPYLINNRLLALYWGIVISTPLEQLINNTSIPFEKFNERVYNIGIVYTFPKFLLIFAHASSFYYNTTNLSEGKQMLYLIEKLHESQGYKNLNKKASVPFNRKYSIIPSKEIILLLDSSLIDDNKDDFCNKNTRNNNSNDWISEIKAILLLNNDVFNTFFPYFDQLKDYYRIYSQYGDKMNYAKMNFSNYRKMLYDGGLMQHSMKGGKRRSLNMSVLTTIRPNMNFSMNMSKIPKNDGDNTNNCKKINKTLSKTVSDPLYKEAKNRRHNNNDHSNANLDLSMTLSKICLSLGKDRNKLDETDISIIFSKLTRNINLNKPREKIRKISLDTSNLFNITEAKTETQMRLSFFLFIKSFVLIAKRLFPSSKDNNEAMKSFITHIIEPFLIRLETKNASTPKEKEDLCNILAAIIQNEEIQQLMKDIKSLIYNHYHNYMNKKKLISFEPFFKFYKDFDIYPHWLSLNTIKDMFFTCVDKEVTFRGKCALNSSQYIKVIKEEKLCFESFLECIMVCGYYMKIGDDLSWCDKVLFLIDKMFIYGDQRSVQRSGKNYTSKKDFSYHERVLMKKYPDYYRKKYGIFERNIRLENEHAFDEVFFE